MKKLLLLRHGNAAPRLSNMSDFDRSLDNIGKKQIANIADKLAESNNLPNFIIASTALRAISSAKIIQNKRPVIKLTGTELLYSASIFEYIDILGSQKETLESIMLVAHNPTISGFISKLTGKHIGMGTGNLCIIELDIQKWSSINFNSVVLNSTLIKP
ncbi:MAG: histidine phosphatase family protein [Spirochaetales bacterium]|nr:histidine phosphatase family protein [Spirochaetales bacterium]